MIQLFDAAIDLMMRCFRILKASIIHVRIVAPAEGVNAAECGEIMRRKSIKRLSSTMLSLIWQITIQKSRADFSLSKEILVVRDFAMREAVVSS